jgi:hypothetical protein
MDNWIELNDNEYSEVWNRVCKSFNFRPSVHKKDWPSFQEPAPFITYDISKISKYEDCIVNEWNEIALRVMKECTDEDELIYILDWSHQFYLFNPHSSKTKIWCYPDGDYYIFLPKDFRWGILTHPWEKTICIFGEELLSCFRKYKPKMLQAVKRQG